MTTATVTRVRLLDGFEDPALADDTLWEGLLARGPSPVVFLTPGWQRAWWSAFGCGRLLLLLAERDGEPLALAPLFADGGMVFSVGAGGSDERDLVGDVEANRVAEDLLDAARSLTDGFVGFRFYHVPDRSPTGAVLRRAAGRLRLEAFDEGDLREPFLDLTDAVALAGAIGRGSLVRHERGLRRDGDLEILHYRDAAAVHEHLDAFFDQHVARWSATPFPSLFADPTQRAFYRALTEEGATAGWLRFTVVRWSGRPVAFHFGASYRSTFLWYKPTFDPALARRSPGEVLLRQLFQAAAHEGAARFDFGLGDEAFKARFATGVNTVRTWGLYPAGGR